MASASIRDVPANDLYKTAESMSPEELDREILASKAHTALLEAAKNLQAIRTNGSLPPGQTLPGLFDSPSQPKPMGKPPSKRKSILRLLGENPDQVMKLAAIREELVKRGWVDASQQTSHSLGITASKMFGRGELHRPRPGHYGITERGKAIDTA